MLQEDLASQTDVIGSADVAPTGMMALFQRAAAGGQDRQDVFVVGDRGSILHHLDQPAIIPHVAESENKKFSFEVCTGCRRLMQHVTHMTSCFRLHVTVVMAGWHTPIAVPLLACCFLHAHLEGARPCCMDAVYAGYTCRPTMARQIKAKLHVDGKPNYPIVTVTLFVRGRSLLSFNCLAKLSVGGA